MSKTPEKPAPAKEQGKLVLSIETMPGVTAKAALDAYSKMLQAATDTWMAKEGHALIDYVDCT